jgi:hypothetical protein
MWRGRRGKVKIFEQEDGQLNKEDRLELAKLLVKAGYTVRVGREKPPGKRSYVYFVEYTEDGGK